MASDRMRVFKTSLYFSYKLYALRILGLYTKILSSAANKHPLHKILLVSPQRSSELDYSSTNSFLVKYDRPRQLIINPKSKQPKLTIILILDIVILLIRDSPIALISMGPWGGGGGGGGGQARGLRGAAGGHAAASAGRPLPPLRALPLPAARLGQVEHGAVAG